MGSENFVEKDAWKLLPPRLDTLKRNMTIGATMSHVFVGTPFNLEDVQIIFYRGYDRSSIAVQFQLYGSVWEDDQNFRVYGAWKAGTGGWTCFQGTDCIEFEITDAEGAYVRTDMASTLPPIEGSNAFYLECEDNICNLTVNGQRCGYIKTDALNEADTVEVYGPSDCSGCSVTDMQVERSLLELPIGLAIASGTVFMVSLISVFISVRD